MYQINISLTSSAATITPPTKDVISLENYVVSCIFGDIPEQINGVTWAPATETSGEYNLADGSESSNSQTSTLTITAAKLATLDGQSSGVHTFTCSYLFGTSNTAVTATQTITIFNPSNDILHVNKYFLIINIIEIFRSFLLIRESSQF